MGGCLGRELWGKQSKDAFCFCHKKFVKKPYLVIEIIHFIGGICHQRHEN